MKETRKTLTARNGLTLFTLVVVGMLVLAALPLLPAAAHEGGPHVRVAHLAPAAPAVDVYVNGKLAVEGALYKDVTDYMALEGYEFKVAVVRAGAPMNETLTKEPVTLKFKEGDSGYYTVAAVGAPADGSFDLILLPADGPAEPHGMSGHGNVEAGKAAAGNIEVSDAFARATAGGSGGHSHGMGMGSKVSAAYMIIRNMGAQADRLLSAESDVAGTVELHETKVENEIAKMIPMPDGFEIPSNGMVELKPGGKHVMLIDLKKDLMAGETITLTLKFQSGTTITFQVPIRQP